MQQAPFHQLPDDRSQPARAFWAQAGDGVRLRMAHWPADAARGSVLLFPGRTEYVEKYAPVAAWLNAAGLSVLSLDWRGQGASARLLAREGTYAQVRLRSGGDRARDDADGAVSG